MFPVDDLESQSRHLTSNAEDAKDSGFVLADTVEACIMRLCGDVVPEEDLLQVSYDEVREASEQNRFFALGHRMLSIDEALNILMKFWYTAIRDQLSL